MRIEKRNFLGNAKDCLELGKKYFQKNLYTNVIDQFSRSYALEQTDLSLQYIGRCYYELNDMQKAQMYFEALIDRTEQDKTKDYGWRMLSIIKTTLGKHNEAIHIIKNCRKTVPNLLNLVHMLIVKFKREGNSHAIDEARNTLDAISKMDVDEKYKWNIAFCNGLLSQAEKNYQDAESYYVLAFELTTNKKHRGEILNELGLLYTNMNLFDKSINVLNDAIANYISDNTVSHDYNLFYFGCAIAEKTLSQYELISCSEISLIEQAKAKESRDTRLQLAKEYFDEVKGKIHSLAFANEYGQLLYTICDYMKCENIEHLNTQIVTESRETLKMHERQANFKIPDKGLFTHFAHFVEDTEIN